MFISVDLPAPFSPSSACTSPCFKSKSIALLASTPGKCLVMPASSRRGASAMALGRRLRGGPSDPPLDRWELLDRVGDLDLPVDDLLLLGLDLVDHVLRDLRADLAESDAIIGEAEDGCSAADLLAVDDHLDRLEHGRIHPLDGAGEDVIAEERLVLVDPDPPDALLLRRVQRAEAAAAGHLEDDVGALGDLVERHLLALRLVVEVLRVAVERLGLRVRVGDGLPIARDEAV